MSYEEGTLKLYRHILLEPSYRLDYNSFPTMYASSDDSVGSQKVRKSKEADVGMQTSNRSGKAVAAKTLTQ